MSSHDSGYYEFSDPAHMSHEERARVESMAAYSYHLLCRQDNRSMSLGDFTAELRECDLRSDFIDAILDYMHEARWVWLWRNRDTQEMWITAYESAVVDDGSSDGDGDEGGW